VVRHNDGQGRVNHEIARAALDEGFEVTLVASHVAPELLAHPKVKWVPVQPSRLWPTNLLRQQVFALKSALWLRRHRREYDVLHVNGFITWAHADVNTAHFVHGGWGRSKYYPFGLTGGVWSAYQYVYTRANAVLERWAYRRSRVIAAVSRKVADEILASGGDPVERLDRLECIDCAVGGVFAKGHLDLTDSGFASSRRGGSARHCGNPLRPR
jgi:hypothetical protein